MNARSMIPLLAVLLTACPKNPTPEGPVDTTTDGVGAQVDAEPAETEVTREMQDLMKDDTALHDKINGATVLLSDPATVDQGLLLLEQFGREHPDVAMIPFNIGVAKFKKGDQLGARSNFDKALTIDPTLGPAYLYLGVLEERAGRVDNAVAKYRDGLAKDPETAELWGALVGALRKQGKGDEGIAQAKKALKINANNLTVYNNLGLIYLDRGDLNLAKFVFQKALNSIPGAEENAYIQSNLGRVYFELGDFPPARFHLAKAVELNPELTSALVYLSHLHLDDRNYVDMVPLLEKAHELEPKNVSVMVNLGIAYRGTERLDEAEKIYRKAIELSPDYAEPWFNLGILYGDYKKDYDKSITAFETYLSKGGDEVQRAQTYLDDIAKEKEREEKRRAREEKRNQREKERAERQRILDEEKAKAAAAPATPTETPAEDAGGAEAPPEGADGAGEPAPEGGGEPAEDAGSDDGGAQ